MAQPPTYLILATPRSGSTLLGQGLQATGLAGEPREFFGHKMAFWMERWRTPTLPTYAERLIQTRATPNGVFGAKLLYRQFLHLESLARQDSDLADLPLANILARLFPNLHLIWNTREDMVQSPPDRRLGSGAGHGHGQTRGSLAPRRRTPPTRRARLRLRWHRRPRAPGGRR
jgi:LPS sulfotransferase NodH